VGAKDMLTSFVYEGDMKSSMFMLCCLVGEGVREDHDDMSPSLEESSRRVKETMVMFSLEVVFSFLVIMAGTQPHVEVGERSQTRVPGSILI
jgi:hypothetical protein